MARKLKSALLRVQAEAAAARAKTHKEKVQQELQLKPKKNSRHKATATWVPFDNANIETVLLVGEGDFSFAAELAKKFYALSIVATSLDSEQEVNEKYADTAPACMETLRSAGSEVAHGVDATQLTKNRFLKGLSSRGRPLKVVFNFPHLGNSVADQDRNIRQHQELLLGLFKEAKSIGASQVVVTLFTGQPYESWQPKQLARSAGWQLERSAQFPWDEFLGYSHQLTSKGGARTNRSQKQRHARMYLWNLTTK